MLFANGVRLISAGIIGLFYLYMVHNGHFHPFWPFCVVSWDSCVRSQCCDRIVYRINGNILPKYLIPGCFFLSTKKQET